MASKWEWLQGKFPKLAPEQGWQERIDTILNSPAFPGLKGMVRDLPNPQIVDRYNLARKHKEELEAQVSALNLEIEAYTFLLGERYEDEGVTSKKFADGSTITITVEPYPQVKPEGKEDFLNWIKSEGMESMLTLPYQTMASMVKARLEGGQMLPPGVDVFLRSKLSRRAGKKE